MADNLQRSNFISMPPISPGNDLAKSIKAEAKVETKDSVKLAPRTKLKSQDRSEQGGFSAFMSGDGKQIAKGISSISPIFTRMNDTNAASTLAIRDSISDAAIKSGNPYAMAIGAAAKTLDAIGDATGFHIDDIDRDAAKRAGVSGFGIGLNNSISAIPGIGMHLAAASEILGGGKTYNAEDLTDEGLSIISSYSGSQGDVNAAKSLSGKRTLFGIGRRKMNKFIDNANWQVDTLDDLGYTNSLAKNSDYNRDLAQQNLNRYAGTNYQSYAVGKNGMKIMSRKELKAILEKRKFQKGGVIGTDTNVLPEGSLHARLNHLQDTNPNLEDTTRKGIPVLDENGEQVAEVEREELILRLEITKKLEDLMKDGSDEAMIEAGKLLASELIENTQDNTGQLTEEDKNE